jgi:hypothetical protein
MTNWDKIICATYALAAILALPATWINNIAFITQSEHNSVGDFFRAVYANPAAASLTNDLFFVALAASVFMIVEGRRLGIKYWWLYLLMSPLVAISVTFPLFLLARHVGLARSSEKG